MDIKFLHIKTIKGEELKLEEINGLLIGEVTPYDPFNKNNYKISVSCSNGRLDFDLNEVEDLSFALRNEKEGFVLPVVSIEKQALKEEETHNGKIQEMSNKSE